jgi:hypothetical protein
MNKSRIRSLLATTCLAPLPCFLVPHGGGSFRLKGVTDNVECYYQVVATLTEELADMVGNVVDEEPNEESDAKIKAALVATNTLT